MAKRAISSADSFSGSEAHSELVSEPPSKRRRVSGGSIAASTVKTQFGRIFSFLRVWNMSRQPPGGKDTVVPAITSASPIIPSIYPALPAPYSQITDSGAAMMANGPDAQASSGDAEKVRQGSEQKGWEGEEQEGTRQDPIDLADESSDEGEDEDALPGSEEPAISGTVDRENDASQAERQHAGPSRTGWSGYPTVGTPRGSSRLPSLARRPRRPDLSGDSTPIRQYSWLDRSESTPRVEPPEFSSGAARLDTRKQRANQTRKKKSVNRFSRRLGQAAERTKMAATLAIGRLKEGVYRKGPTEGEASKQTFQDLLASSDRPFVQTIVKPTRPVHDVLNVKKTTERAREHIAVAKSEDLEDLLARVELEKKVKDEAVLARLKPAVPTELKEEESEVVDAAFQDRTFRRIIATGDVSANSLKRLRPNVWLDDEIVNFYGGMLQKRANDNADGHLPKIHFLNSFFYPKMEQGYTKQLGRWTKKVKVFELDLLLMPINLGNAHWTAAAFNLKEKRLEYYDSMGDYSNQARHVFKVMRAWLEAEHQDKLSRPYDMSDWTMIYSDDTPQQDNGNDCGVFSCQTLESLARGKDLVKGEWDFTAEHMPFFRRMMVYEIAQGEMYKRW